MRKLKHFVFFASLLCTIAFSCTDKKPNPVNNTKSESNLQKEGTVDAKIEVEKINELKAIQKDIEKETKELENLLEEIEN